MNEFTYTPYDGSAKPFTMGMKPCDEENWIEVDSHLAEHLLEKNRLLTENREAVFQSLDGMQEAEQEVLDLMLAHLTQYFPEIYEIDGETVTIKPLDHQYRIRDFSAHPLSLAGRLVQEDLCIIRPEDGRHILAAASLCFPSSWRLSEKIGKPMEQVHAPVPGYQDNLAQKVNYMMDRIPPEMMIWRMNWSLDEGPELHRPSPHSHDRWLAEEGDPMDHIFIRVERQTVRRLPATGVILFTIRIYTDALARLKAHPEASSLASGLLMQLENMTEAELVYKGLINAQVPIKIALRSVIDH